MNPFMWHREHQLALLIAMAIGASLGLVLGYLVYATGQGVDGALAFGDWIERPLRRGGLWWFLFGGAIGAGVVYVRRLASS